MSPGQGPPSDPILSAATEAEGRGDYRRALRFFEEWEAGGGPTTPRERCEADLLAAQLLRMNGRSAEAAERAHRAVTNAEADHADLLPRALRNVGALELRAGHLARAEAAFERALALAAEPTERSRLLGELALAAEHRGRRDRSDRLYREAVACLDPIADAHDLAHLLTQVGDTRRLRGDLTGARDAFEQARRKFETVGNAFGRARCLDGLATVAYAEGEFRAALRMEHWALELYTDIGHRVGMAESWNLCGDAWRALGDLDRAEHAYREAIDSYAAAGAVDATVAKVNLALVLLARGHDTDARLLLTGLQAEIDALGWRSLSALCDVFLLPCAEAERDEAAWELHYRLASRRLAETRAIDRDAAHIARLAAERAEKRATDRRLGPARVAAALSRAVRARELALAQWSGLGVEREARVERSELRVLAAQDAPLPVGPFDLVEPVGAGAMGEVWRGVHRGSGLAVAVKLVQASAAPIAAQREALAGEVRAVAALDHPAIVRVLDHGTVGAAVEAMTTHRFPAGSPFFAMELATGGTLAPLAGRMPWAEVRGTLLSLLDALAHAHARGVVHLDLKPANILLHEGRVKLTDFGIAGALRGLVGRRVVVGTPHYMAPEQFRGSTRDFGPWTDIYALGCVAAELVGGRRLFDDDTLEALQLAHDGPLPAIRPVISVPDGLDGWIRRCLSPTAEHRFQRAADAAWALQQLRGLPTGPRSPRHHTAPDPTTLALTDWNDDFPTEERVAWQALGLSDVPPTPMGWHQRHPPAPPIDLVDAGLGLFDLRAVPLVGRERERGLLWAILRDVTRRGRAEVVAIEGPAGVGKTSLATWLGQRAHELGVADVFVARHGPEPSPDHGLAAMLRRDLVCDGLEAEQVRARLPLTSDTDDLAAWLTGAPIAVQPSTLVARFLGRRAARRTAIVILDDALWGTHALTLATELAGTPARILVVLTVRDDARPMRPGRTEQLEALLDGDATIPVPLGRLDPGTQRALVDSLLPLHPDVATRVGRRADGTPQFAIALVRDLVHRGALASGKRGFELIPGADLELPSDVVAAWTNRLRELEAGSPAGAMVTVALAAVLGATVNREEWVRAAAAVPCVSPDEVAPLLVDARLLEPRPDGWQFAHAMVREAALRLAGDGLRALHVACAEVVGDPARRGTHFAAGGLPEKALPDLDDATWACARDGRYDEGLQHLQTWTRALHALAVPEADPRWGGLWLADAMLAHVRGDWERAEAQAQRARDAARRHRWTGVLPRALRALADVDRLCGRLEIASAGYLEAKALFSGQGHAMGAARCLYGLGVMARARGDHGEAEGLLRQAIALVPDPDDAFGSVAQLGLAGLLRTRGELAEARAIFEAVLETCRRTGRPALVVDCWTGLGETERLAGDLDAAHTSYTRALDGCPLGDATRRALVRVNLGVVDLARGRFDAAAATLEAVLHEVERSQGALACIVRVMVTPCRVGLDDAAWAAHVDIVESRLADLGLTDPDLAWALELAADRARALGHGDRAGTLLTLALDQWVSLGRPEDAARVHAARS